MIEPSPFGSENKNGMKFYELYERQLLRNCLPLRVLDVIMGSFSRVEVKITA